MKSDAVLPERPRVLGELLGERHSCRAFLPDEVDPVTLERILSMAQRTASWCNTQPWQVVLTRGDATQRLRDALAGAPDEDDPNDFPFPPHYEGEYLARRRESGFQLYEAVGVQRGDRAASAKQAAENFRFFGAPHVAIVTTPAHLGVYGAIDCGGWVSNFMLGARALGVAACAQAALARRPRLLRSHFGLAEDRLVVCGISFGYCDTAHRANSYRTSRAEVASAVRIVS